jgi:hypothetical protein
MGFAIRKVMATKKKKRKRKIWQPCRQYKWSSILLLVHKKKLLPLLLPSWR